MLDSFHIYGSYERRNEVATFISQVEKLPFEKRVARTDSPLIKKEFEKAKVKLANEKSIMHV